MRSTLNYSLLLLQLDKDELVTLSDPTIIIFIVTSNNASQLEKPVNRSLEILALLASIAI